MADSGGRQPAAPPAGGRSASTQAGSGCWHPPSLALNQCSCPLLQLVLSCRTPLTQAPHSPLSGPRKANPFPHLLHLRPIPSPLSLLLFWRLALSFFTSLLNHHLLRKVSPPLPNCGSPLLLFPQRCTNFLHCTHHSLHLSFKLSYFGCSTRMEDP